MHALVLYGIANVCARSCTESEEATASSTSLLATHLKCLIIPVPYVTSILKTLKTCVHGGREAKQRETKPPLWLRKLKAEWGKKMASSFLYASSCGSLGAVKYLLANRQKPNIRYIYIVYCDCYLL